MNYKNNIQKGGAISVSNVKSFIDNSYKKDSDERVNDFILDKNLSNDYAKTYYNPGTQQAVVVHRGTSGASDWLNNAAYAAGVYNFTKRYKTGKKIQDKANKKYGKSNISTLGHSQGSVLSRKLGKDSREIINVNPAYMGEKRGKNEFNIRSSSDLVSGILAPVNVVSKTLFPKYTKNHEITIQSENPVDVLTEHSPEILNRLDPDRMIGKGIGSTHTHADGTIMTGKTHTSKSKVIGKVGGIIEFEDCHEYIGGIIEFQDSDSDEDIFT